MPISTSSLRFLQPQVSSESLPERFSGPQGACGAIMSPVKAEVNHSFSIVHLDQVHPVRNDQRLSRPWHLLCCFAGLELAPMRRGNKDQCTQQSKS